MMRTLLLPLLLLCGAAFAGDPSAEPVRALADDTRYGERWRIIADLDGDGHPDMLLSAETSEFGKAGGAWGVYLWRNNGYKQIGEIFSSPHAVSVEFDHDRSQREEAYRFFVRIWTYARSSGSSGRLSYYRIGPNSVEEAPMRVVKL